MVDFTIQINALNMMITNLRNGLKGDAMDRFKTIDASAFSKEAKLYMILLEDAFKDRPKLNANPLQMAIGCKNCLSKTNSGNKKNERLHNSNQWIKHHYFRAVNN